MCINLLSRRKNFNHSIKQIKTAFDNQVIVIPSRDEGNAIAVASAKLTTAVSSAPTFSLSELQAAAQRLRQATHLNLLPMLANLAASGHLKEGVLQL